MQREDGEEGKGWRGMAVRAGLLHPASPRIAFIPTAHHASLTPPSLPAFGLPTQQQLLSRWRNPLALFSTVSHLDAGVQLSGTHTIGVGTVLEALLQGSKVHLDELRLRMSKTIFSPSSSEKIKPCDSAKLALSLASDLQQRSRATLESIIGTKEDGHTISCVLSSDFQSQLAWGVASSHRLGKTWTFFTRFSKDDYAGERFILQVVHELNAMNKLSTIYATTVGHYPQAGFSWTHETCKEGDRHGDVGMVNRVLTVGIKATHQARIVNFNFQPGEVRKSLSFKGLCSGDGKFSVSIKAEVGSV